MPANGARLLDNQESLIEGLLAIESNMTKLPLARRDEAKLGSVMNGATTYWTSIQANHKKIMALVYIPTSYRECYGNAGKCYGKICRFVGEQFPKLVPEGVEIVDVDAKTDDEDGSDYENNGGSGGSGPGGPDGDDPAGNGDGDNDENGGSGGGDPGGNSDSDDDQSGGGGPGGPGGGGSGGPGGPGGPDGGDSDGPGGFNGGGFSAADMAKIMEMMLQSQKLMAENASRNTQAIADSHRSMVEIQRTKSVREPVEDFDGDFRKYIVFRETFQKYFAKKTDLSDTDKVMVLRKHLKGDALQRITNVDITKEGLTAHWRQLDLTYDRPRRILEANMEAFTAETKFAKINRTYKEMQALQSRYNTTLVNLSASKTSLETYINFLCTKQFDVKTKTRFEDTVGMFQIDMPGRDEFNTFFERELQILAGENGDDEEENEEEEEYY